MKTLLVRIILLIVFLIVSTIIYLAKVGERLRIWLEEEEPKPKKDSIREHQKYAPHKY